MQGIQFTKVMQDYLAHHSLDMDYVVRSANNLRFDRPVVEFGESKPELTISMLLSYGESIELMAASVRDIISWNESGVALQLIIWVHGAEDSSRSRLNMYRNKAIARLIHETRGTNVRLRSGILINSSKDIDQIVQRSLTDMAFAYWKCFIPVDHQVFVINSRNELLRWGTFWQFMRQEHKVPNQPFSAYMQVLKQPIPIKHKASPITTEHDHQAQLQARIQLAMHTPRSKKFLLRLQQSPTKQMSAAMRHARLQWTQTDDLAYNLIVHDHLQPAIAEAKRILCIPVRYQKNLPSNMHTLAREVMLALQKKRQRIRQLCYRSIRR